MLQRLAWTIAHLSSIRTSKYKFCRQQAYGNHRFSYEWIGPNESDPLLYILSRFRHLCIFTRLMLYMA